MRIIHFEIEECEGKTFASCEALNIPNTFIPEDDILDVACTKLLIDKCIEIEDNVASNEKTSSILQEEIASDVALGYYRLILAARTR